MTVTSKGNNVAESRFYLRFGELPASGFSHNYATGEPEFGISVYDLDDNGQPVVPPDDEYGIGTLQMRLASDDPAYIVTGDEAGIGHDGEPVLRNVQIIREWTPTEAQ